MDRREAIGRVALLLGGTVIGAEFFISGCKSTDKKVNELFTESNIAFLNEVADTILPDTKTPGAKAADVGRFMTVMVKDCYSSADQKVFLKGIDQLDKESEKRFGKKFMDCDRKQHTELLTNLDNEQKQYMKAKKPDAPNHYFRMLKELTLLGYFTSEIGCTKAMRYVPVPGRFDGNIAYHKGDKAWALY